MSNKLTKRQEIFCVKYFELGNASEAARIAGYSPKWAGVNTCQILRRPSIQARIKELQEKEDQTRKAVEMASVMSVLERKQRLTEIARACLTEFMELGQDGSWVNLGPETEHGGAIHEIHSHTILGKDGADSVVYASVKLHDPMKAIDLLNKMEKIYSDGYQDNRVIKQFNIYVIDNEARDLIGQVGERTKLLNGNANNQSIQGSTESMGGQEEGDTP